MADMPTIIDYKAALLGKHLTGELTTARPASSAKAFLLAGAFLAVGVVLLKTNQQINSAGYADAMAAEITPAYRDKLSADLSAATSALGGTGSLSAPAPAGPTTAGAVWRKITVRSGDTISDIFNALNLHDDYLALFQTEMAANELRSIHPGQTINMRMDGRGLEEMVYQSRDTARLHVIRSGNFFRASLEPVNLEKSLAVGTGVISHSLFMDALNAGLTGPSIMQLTDIFQWDIDFSLDVREGDRFSVVYEQYYQDGKRVRDGDILAAEFSNQGTIYRAFRYTDSRGNVGYFTQDGRNVRRPFLRSPVNFTRISSPFSLGRLHPILNTIRAHRGVDYAAPIGTPIIAAGDGRVVYRGVKGGYGNTVILLHGTVYSTLYGHMSSYAQGLDVGSHVKQGDVIGYVGQTGLATGPHLHYEFRIQGVHHNPVTVKLPGAQQLPARELAAFLATIQPAIAKLDANTSTVAAAKTTLE